MSQNPVKPPLHQTSSQINQTAGENATQIGQVYGNVILNQFQRHPTFLYLVLFFAMVGLCVITWRIAPLIGVRNNFLNSVGETICGVTQPVSTLPAFQSPSPDASSPPTERGSTSIPEPIVTQEPIITPVVPSPQNTGHIGTWAGFTQQGEPISFTVAKDSGGEAAFNLSTSFVFNSPCPIGRVSFKSLNNAHLFGGPSYTFRFINLTTSNAGAYFEGNLTDTTASGIFRVNDARDPSARQDQACPFITTITWNAKKQ